MGGRVKHLAEAGLPGVGLPEEFVIRATGRYYTHRAIASHLVTALLRHLAMEVRPGDIVRACDPFAGDGRLLRWLLEHWQELNLPRVMWRLALWDLNREVLERAASELDALCVYRDIPAEVTCLATDSFEAALGHEGGFDVVLTNPPWELLKPDSRELARLAPSVRATYVGAMRDYDRALSVAFPDAQPLKKFAGWGTNLSRVGLDLSRKICRPAGYVAIVMPASFLADGQSVRLRREFLLNCSLLDAAYFPAEARLFGRADLPTSSLVFRMSPAHSVRPRLTTYTSTLGVSESVRVELQDSFLRDCEYVVPISSGVKSFELLRRLAKPFPIWQALEGGGECDLWAGREVDETRHSSWLISGDKGSLFVKGRMIDRYSIRTSPAARVGKPGWTPPNSVSFERIAWRDVSRPNQKRRLIATIVPPGWVAGNSLGVAHFRDGNGAALKALLGVMNSMCFEFQLRGYLATGHVSLSSLRRVHVPPREVLQSLARLVDAVEDALAGKAGADLLVEAIVAKCVYGLARQEFELLSNCFPKVTGAERAGLLAAYDALAVDEVLRVTSETRCERASVARGPASTEEKGIANHISARLSKLDMQMVRAVPPGGNWKDIPVGIRSSRLEQIRISYKAGKGSRSTYYGRLRPDMPAYTINTYFNRPGNGCHIHYCQDRVLSQREAARLQSFPDDFEFFGPQSAVNNQIGNAVPPLLAYQIARHLGPPACFVDLFSGAGGLGLGFKWAGWTPVVANDIEGHFLETYSRNVHPCVVTGSIMDERSFEALVTIATEAKRSGNGRALWVLGGPPCQGFSTAGNRRSMEDERNHLFEHYKRFVECVRPEGFLFENVTGLLNMQGGRVFEFLRGVLGSVMPVTRQWVLKAEEYAIPQRRTRVFLAGVRSDALSAEAPSRITSCQPGPQLFESLHPAISVEEALGDLPALRPGEDGCRLPYASLPRNPYQALMRGCIDAEEYLGLVKAARHEFKMREEGHVPGIARGC